MDGITKPIDLVPILASNGVDGDRLKAAALEAQKQQVLWAAVNNVGARTGSGYRPAARALMRKTFKGLTLTSTWDVMEDDLDTLDKWGRYTNVNSAPGWWYDSRQAPRDVLIGAGLLNPDAPASTCECGDPTCTQPDQGMVWCRGCGQHEEAS